MKKIFSQFEAKVKIRYRQSDQKAILDINPDWKYFVKFENKQRAIASWQICAFYDENDFLLASWVID